MPKEGNIFENLLKDFFPELSGGTIGILILLVIGLVALCSKTALIEVVKELVRKLFFAPQKDPSDLQLRGWRDSRDRENLLERLKSEISPRLANSLHHEVSISLKMEMRHSQVNPAFKLSLQGAKPDRSLPEGTSITSVYESCGISHKLLILGEPGSGKTTSLLTLAEGLLKKAEQEPLKPMPVLFECSTWTGAPIKEWLAAELKRNYKIPEDAGMKLLAQGGIFPLLDGLDEITGIDRQEGFVRNLNQYQDQGETTRLVVCSRREEYGQLEEKARLNGAVYLEPLTEPMVRDYLRRVKEDRLWEALKDHPSLLEMMQTPLFLNMMVLCRERMRAEGIPDFSTKEEYQEFLFETYIGQCLDRKDSTPLQYPLELARKWLSWLAGTMNSESIREFILEDHLQPALLKDPLWLGCAVTLCLMLAFGLVLGLAVGLAWLALWLAVGLALGLKKLSKTIPKKSRPNQGILRSGANGLVFGGIVSPFIIFFAFHGGWVLLPFFIFFFFIYFGGQAFVEHYCLRFLLCRQGHLPFLYVKFLNLMAERRLLQRVGGKYRLIHPLLQDHFAEDRTFNIEGKSEITSCPL